MTDIFLVIGLAGVTIMLWQMRALLRDIKDGRTTADDLVASAMRTRATFRAMPTSPAPKE